MEVVVDTNVLVSGLIRSHGCPAEIVQMITCGELVPAFDLRIVHEYGIVLSRDIFGFSKIAVERLLSAIRRLGRQVIPPHATVSLPDEKDRCFYECALVAQTNILITGNKKHFPPGLCTGIRILSPNEFLSTMQ
ncbi:MAG: putative toxin-antitoxin system toxin component, PIN family [Candidatus Raymondbacteria bacterium RifOxyA12_full_50_37]|uniref:Putative toxin-antitoxin system toxin component, PIN family n=1 Tax=Candidatus Raymondbacteria bacterium RIFOXYD12_FULL_49_13 TaxID=1817890 RepID=A0A1F7F368_UNCRA|nr:MAG: putative toxin-antitoxin system toxin component, PIN family [Candidatus Raymondbacteria bacterium RifOxyA12_full_50_37]OGJ89148.1 MAG: putative toxin-antitoxin system toxin component, PIN family [Candidatus Raymondbacteria bacterium RIFOXYA2_FULL_49_16]OGJ96630.1 MAG: putative toxin-antitoxin system toxin component, PIN family [Candidatus Raymondbacteria bacterium RIFOXYC2_FULL_50_21]OGK01081.1 MAG: putative toxin-antitoxin system toxin component, PIN family [Candidatus Raymondbacteria b